VCCYTSFFCLFVGLFVVVGFLYCSISTSLVNIIAYYSVFDRIKLFHQAKSRILSGKRVSFFCIFVLILVFDRMGNFGISN
jgi:hypothetical protein